MSFNFLNTNLNELNSMLKNKEISAAELAKHSLDNVKKIDNDVKSLISTTEDLALEQANKVDENSDFSNILSGIPMVLKDNIAVKNQTTTAASKILQNFKPVYNATVTDKLNEAGTVLIGKANMDEFAMGGSTKTSYYAKTANAWNLDKVPGGSSGGSASVVASGIVPFSLGSDTGGSIRQPASFNGIVGMKPTYGRVSRWGLFAMASSLDQIGPLTTNVYDNAVVLNSLVGKDVRDSTSSVRDIEDFTNGLDGDIKGMKIAVPKEYFGEGVDPKVAEVVKAAIKQLEALGAIVDEVSLPNTKYGIAAYYIIMSAEASSNLQRYDGVRYGYRSEDVKNLEDLYVKSRSEGFGDEVKRRIMLGTYALSAGFYDAYFKKAAEVRTLIINDFNKVFSEYDVIVGPTAPTPAFDLNAEFEDPTTMYMADVFTVPVNLAGLPGISVNAGFADGLPVGLQIIGNKFAENTLYRVAYAFEKAANITKQPEIASKL